MIEKEEFLNKKNEIMAEKINAKDKIKFHKGSIGAWHDYAENLIIRASHIYEVFSEGDNEDKKALLMAIGENYRLKDGLVTFDLKPPFNFIKALNKAGSSSSRLLPFKNALASFDWRAFRVELDAFTATYNIVLN